MGVYDLLVGSCPSCGKKVSTKDQVQIKWFSEPSFREFAPGDALPEQLADGDYVTNSHMTCDCTKILPFFAKIRGNKYLGLINVPETNIKNINFSTYKIEELTNRLVYERQHDKKILSDNLHNQTPTTIKLLIGVILLYIGVCFGLITYGFLDQFCLPSNNFTNFALNVLSDTLVTVIAFCLALWKGERILEVFSENRRLSEWKRLGNLCELHLNETLNHAASKIKYNSGLVIYGGSTAIFRTLTNELQQYTQADSDSKLLLRSSGLIPRVVFALPQDLQAIKSLQTSLNLMLERYSDALPTTLQRRLLEVSFELNHLFTIVDDAGGFAPPPPLITQLQKHISVTEVVKFDGHYAPWDESSILESLSRVFALLSFLTERRSEKSH